MEREGGCTTGLSPVAAHGRTTLRALSTFVRPRSSHVLMDCRWRSLALQYFCRAAGGRQRAASSEVKSVHSLSAQGVHRFHKIMVLHADFFELALTKVARDAPTRRGERFRTEAVSTTHTTSPWNLVVSRRRRALCVAAHALSTLRPRTQSLPVMRVPP